MNFREFIEDQPLYFGCQNDAGHYVWSADHHIVSIKNPIAYFLTKNDAQLAPINTKEQGKAILHHFPEFTILAYWDYKVDKRPGSNSMFLIPGQKTPEETIVEIKKAFPKIWNRSPATIIGEMNHAE